MRPVQLLSAASLLFASAAVAVDNLQLNFYSDHDCSAWMGSLQGGWATPLSNPDFVMGINYQYGTSVNIAACDHAYCMCQMYLEEERQGEYWTLVYGMEKDGNCLRDAQMFKSYSCFYY